MNTYEQLELDLVTEIENLETEIKERAEFIEEHATREFSLPNFREITYIMERKLDNLKRALEYLQDDARAGSEEQQAERLKQAAEEERIAKGEPQEGPLEEIKQEILRLGYKVGALNSVVSLTKQATKEIIEVLRFEEEANNVYFTIRNKLYVAEIETWNENEKDIRIITGMDYFNNYGDIDALEELYNDDIITKKEYKNIMDVLI